MVLIPTEARERGPWAQAPLSNYSKDTFDNSVASLSTPPSVVSVLMNRCRFDIYGKERTNARNNGINARPQKWVKIFFVYSTLRTTWYRRKIMPTSNAVFVKTFSQIWKCKKRNAKQHILQLLVAFIPEISHLFFNFQSLKKGCHQVFF